jgi:hypothetical protein
MPDENNQSAPAERTRVTSIAMERVFNLGDYENIKYNIRVEVAHGDDPTRVLVSLENILNNLRAKSGVSDYMLERAKRALEKPESELTESEKVSLDDYRSYVQRDEDAQMRRRKAREALSTLDYTNEHKDHKRDWDDGPEF